MIGLPNTKILYEICPVVPKIGPAISNKQTFLLCNINSKDSQTYNILLLQDMNKTRINTHHYIVSV